MRILQISSARTYGGGERHVIDLSRGLHERGHEIFAAVRPTCTWRKRLDFLPEQNIFNVSIRNSFGVLSAMRIAEFVRDNDIELIHAHVARDYIPASIACMAAKKSQYLVTRHVMFPLKPFNKFALRNCARFVGVSDAVGVELRRLFAKDRVRVIPNGIDLERYKADSSPKKRADFREFHSIPAGAQLVGALGELKEQKGQRDLVLSAHEVLKDVPNAYFVIVGQDHSLDGRFRRELKRLASVMGMEQRFLWLDWLEDTSEFFAAIDLFISPSHSESFGLAILEAMAFGIAVVATETEGAKQLLGETDQLVPVRDPLKLSRAIVRFLTGDLDRMEAAASGKMRADEKYSLAKMLDATEALYREIIAEKA
ncbi:MAG: glycosyltransferase family 4 protein [Acidobacteria bacterium]|nr:glycosyltransferase family 4 protein [Acidobacteriota bacterium]